MKMEHELFAVVEAIDTINRGIIEFSAVNIPDKYTSDLKNALNRFFTDYTCGYVTISNNTDKEFFGAYVYRNINMNVVLQIQDIRDIEEEKFGNNYKLDIDSKLFNIGLNSYKIASLLLYDLYKMLTMETTVDLIQTIDCICANRRQTIGKKGKSELYIRLLDLCALDYIYRKYSIFTRRADELIRIPDLLVACNMDSGFDAVCGELFKYTNVGERLSVNPALCLNWVVAAICAYDDTDDDIFEVLNDYINTSGSNLFVGLANKLANDMKAKVMKSTRNLAASIKEASLFSKIRKNGLKSLENDLYEYEMRVKNIEDENSAIFLMRQINSRMGIIQDYLDEENISEPERRRWENVFYRYERLRVKMTNKPIYSRKMYGLFTDYNALMQPGPENIMTMQTVY